MAKSKAKKKPNENFIHSCNSPLVDISKYKCSFSQIDYTDREFKEIVCFYVLHDFSSKKDDSDISEPQSLKEHGWKGKAILSKLEREFLRKSDIPSFCFIKAPSISETLEQMTLGEKNCCIEHPRAVLMQNYKVDVYQSGEMKMNEKETRMSCLFRHIRNALAHNQIYSF